MKHTHTRRFTRTLLAAVIAPAMAVGAATAGATGTSSANAASPPAAARPPQATTTDKAAIGDRFVRASRLIGSDVRNSAGENLGEIKDVIVDARDGSVRYAVLSFGGLLGVGNKLFAYPMTSFTPSAYGHDLILNVDKARLKSAPGFEPNHWPDWNRTAYTGEVDRYFGRPSMSAQGELRRASDLLGADVNDRNGEDIGHLEDLVVNASKGKIDYAVIEVDRLGDFPDKLIQAPLQSLKATGERDTLAMNVDVQAIDRRQGFDRRHWPDLNDESYRVSAQGYINNGPWRSWYDTNAMTAASTTADRFRALDRNGDGVLSREEFAGERASR